MVLGVVMRNVFGVISFALLILGCTTTQEIKRPDGNIEYLIACGASLGWNDNQSHQQGRKSHESSYLL
jgi:hypothetical protein